MRAFTTPHQLNKCYFGIIDVQAINYQLVFFDNEQLYSKIKLNSLAVFRKEMDIIERIGVGVERTRPANSFRQAHIHESLWQN